MATTWWTFPSGANGDAGTGANTGSAYVVVTGGSMAISTAHATFGTRSLYMQATSTSGACYFTKQGLSAATGLGAAMYFTPDVGPATSTVSIMWVGTTSRGVSLEWNLDRTLTIKDQPNNSLWAGATKSTTALAIGTTYLICLYVVPSATVGQVQAAIYNSSGTLIEASTLFTNRNTLAGPYTDIRYGLKTSTGTSTAKAYVDAWGYDGAATGLSAPYNPNNPPTSNAGADVTVDAGEAYTLTGTATDVEGVASVAWKLSGSTVGTANTLTRTAPITLAGTSQTYTFEVTDTGGLMTPDSVVVTVLPATIRLHNGTALVPAINRLTI